MTGFPMQTMPQEPNQDDQAQQDAALMEQHAQATAQLAPVVADPRRHAAAQAHIKAKASKALASGNHVRKLTAKAAKAFSKLGGKGKKC